MVKNKWFSTLILAELLVLLCFITPLLQATEYTYIPVVEWNGVEYRIMNGSGAYEWQPVHFPEIDVPFSNSNGVAAWRESGNTYVYVVDSFHDRVKFFQSDLRSVQQTDADWVWMAGAADEAGEYDENDIYVGVGATNAPYPIIRGSEQLTINNVLYSRVGSLDGYDDDDPVYTIDYDATGATLGAHIQFKTTAPSAGPRSNTDAIKLEFVLDAENDDDWYGDVDYAITGLNPAGGTITGEPFEITEVIPEAIDFENLAAIATSINSADPEVVDLYLLERGESATMDPAIHAYRVHYSASNTFEWVSTYNSPMDTPGDIAFAESDDNVVPAYTDGVDFSWSGGVTLTTEIVVRNNAFVTNHDYSVTVTNAPIAVPPSDDLTGLMLEVRDESTGNLIDHYEQTTPTSTGDVIDLEILPGLTVRISPDATTEVPVDEVLTVAPTNAALAELNDYLFVCDTGNHRIKVVKAADNGEDNGEVSDYFEDDAEREDYYGIVDASSNVPNYTLVTALKPMEDTFTLYSVDGIDTTEWTRVDNFAGSGPNDTHYMFDYRSQVILFGDGNFGLIPEIGDVLFSEYTPCLDVLQYGSSGSSNGRFNEPSGITARWNEAQGWFDVYVSDTGNNRIAKMKFTPSSDGRYATMEWVTSWTNTYTGSPLSSPSDLVVLDNEKADATDSVYVFACDTGNDRIVVYRDLAAENEGNGGSTAPQYVTTFGGTGTGLGGFAHPTGISVIHTDPGYDIFVADADRNIVTKFEPGVPPQIMVDYSNISEIGYMPTGQYTFQYSATNYPEDSYVRFFYSDTTTAGQASPIACSNSHFEVDGRTFTWHFTETPSGALADGYYYIYGRLYSEEGFVLSEHRSPASSPIIINSELTTGIGLYDALDEDSYLYLQNNSLRQVNLTAIYPENIAAIEFTGYFPADQVQIVSITQGPAWSTIQNQGVIFEPTWNNTTGTYQVNTAVLGSNTGLTYGEITHFVVAVLTLEVLPDAIGTSDRLYEGTLSISNGDWADVLGVNQSIPRMNDLNLRIAYLGDIAQPGADRGTFPHLVPMPDGVFSLDDIVVFSIAWNGFGGEWDPIADLAPWYGNIPDIWREPDGVLNVLDLMAFTTMFDWYLQQGFDGGSVAGLQPSPSGRDDRTTSANDPLVIESTLNGDNILLDIYCNDPTFMAAEYDLQLNWTDWELVNVNQNCQADNAGIFHWYERPYGVQLFLSSLSMDGNTLTSDGHVSIELRSVSDSPSEPVLGYDLRSVSGELIASGSKTVQIDAIDQPLPSTFAMGQNYPNPFNSATMIQVDIPEASLVQVRIFDILGREVAVLANESLQADHTLYYGMDWISATMPSPVESIFTGWTLDNFIKRKNCCCYGKNFDIDF